MKIKRMDVKDLRLANKETDIDYFEIRTTPMSMKVRNVIDEVKDEMIVIPSLQRDNNAWNKKKQSLFIDSILRNFPIPPIMTMTVSKKTIVLDGQQRINAMADFKMNSLKLNLGQSNKWSGLKYKDLNEEMKFRFDQFVLQIQQVEQLSPAQDDGSIAFEIFNRINSKSTPLTRMQVRYAAFYSDYTVYIKDLANKLNASPIWINEKPEAIAEKILRFVAFYTIFRYEGSPTAEALTKQSKTILDFNETIDKLLRNAMTNVNMYVELTDTLVTFLDTLVSKSGIENFYSKRPSGGTTNKIQVTILDAVAYAAGKNIDLNTDEFKSLSERTDNIIASTGYDFYKNYFQQTTTLKQSIIKRFEFINENKITEW